MKQIREQIKLEMYYLPCGDVYENSKDGYLSLRINNSDIVKYSKEIKSRDMSVRQLTQYLEDCIEDVLNENK